MAYVIFLCLNKEKGMLLTHKFSSNIRIKNVVEPTGNLNLNKML